MDSQLSLKEKFESITITHFINPHMFWFRPEISYFINEKYLKLEDTIHLYFSEKLSYDFKKKQYFNVGDIVAVYMPTWAKWIRGCVDHYVTLLNDQQKCILWAVDLGFPLESNLELLKPLPIELEAAEHEHSFYGGLINILPCEQSFDFMKNESVSSVAKSWSTLAVKEFQNIIEQASNMKFNPVKVLNDHVFGRLEVTMYNGKTYDANDILVKLSTALRADSTEKFFKEMHNIKTTKLKRYMNNDGILSFGNLSFSKPLLRHPNLKEFLPEDYIPNPTDLISLKVQDWERRNTQIKDIIESTPTIVSEIDPDNEIFESISCYITNDKAVRNANTKNDTVEDGEKTNESDDEKTNVLDRTDNTSDILDDESDQSDECLMNQCDLIRIGLVKKYKGEKPREPKSVKSPSVDNRSTSDSLDRISVLTEVENKQITDADKSPTLAKANSSECTYSDDCSTNSNIKNKEDVSNNLDTQPTDSSLTLDPPKTDDSEAFVSLSINSFVMKKRKSLQKLENKNKSLSSSSSTEIVSSILPIPEDIEFVDIPENIETVTIIQEAEVECDAVPFEVVKTATQTNKLIDVYEKHKTLVVPAGFDQGLIPSLHKFKEEIRFSVNNGLLDHNREPLRYDRERIQFSIKNNNISLNNPFKTNRERESNSRYAQKSQPEQYLVQNVRDDEIW